MRQGLRRQEPLQRPHLHRQVLRKQPPGPTGARGLSALHVMGHTSHATHHMSHITHVTHHISHINISHATCHMPHTSRHRPCLMPARLQPAASQVTRHMRHACCRDDVAAAAAGVAGSRLHITLLLHPSCTFNHD